VWRRPGGRYAKPSHCRLKGRGVAPEHTSIFSVGPPDRKRCGSQGDEFTVLLEDAGEPSVVAYLTAGMHAIFAETIHTMGRALTIGASVGVAFAGADDTADVIVHAADLAMYNVKRAQSPRDAVIV
jgi:predicted signal transduction protein with EAL and GGDEF domain